MSEDKTEAATARRLSRARDEGQAPISREAVSAFGLAAAYLVLTTMTTTADGLDDARRAFAAILSKAGDLSPGAGVALAGGAALRMMVPLALAVGVAAIVATVLQTGFLLHLEAAMPDLGRLDPRRGLRRVLGPAALAEAGKSVLKLALAGVAVWPSLGVFLGQAPALTSRDPAVLSAILAAALGRVMLAVLAAHALFAVADIARARWSHARGLRMTRQEIRDEHRETEGDPHVKARVKALRRARARRRMMAAVPSATVVVTNPTHYAVALAYDRDSGRAPRVVAKGTDAVAARIRAVAEHNRVPMVANPPLARALHEVSLEAEIPVELFQAVAEVIAYVWRLATPVSSRAAPPAPAASGVGPSSVSSADQELAP